VAPDENGVQLIAMLRSNIAGTEGDRARELLAVHGRDREILGNMMALRCFESAELAYIGGAFAAAVVAAITSVRHQLLQTLDLEDRDELQVAALKHGSLSRLARSVLEGGARYADDVTQRLEELTGLEDRYMSWQTPFSSGTLEETMRRETLADGRPRDALDDAHGVMREDALLAVSAAYRMLHP
jgi:hypothetical protein